MTQLIEGTKMTEWKKRAWKLSGRRIERCGKRGKGGHTQFLYEMIGANHGRAVDQQLSTLHAHPFIFKRLLCHLNIFSDQTEWALATSCT
jgi:hypothetical protein